MHNQGMNSSAVVRKEKTMDDLISRQTALTALAEAMPSLTTPDGCGQFDHDIQVTDEAYVDCMRIIHDLPSAQPGWTYIEEALPKTIINEHTHDYQEYNCLCDFGDNGFDVRTYKFGNGHFWNGGGNVDKYVTAWQPLPEIPDALKQKPWEGGQE